MRLVWAINKTLSHFSKMGTESYKMLSHIRSIWAKIKVPMKNENGGRSHLHGWETEAVQDVSSPQIDIRSNTANQILQVTLWVETKRSERF